jgi:uncharacterized cofD-like protein
MADQESVREVLDRFGRVKRKQARYTVEFDPVIGLNRCQLVPGTSLQYDRRLEHVVALGGGTGLPVVLEGLRRHLPADCRITAVVTVADNGGSSGVLRNEYGVLPPGDIRNCLLALARVAPEVSAALQYRFEASSGPQHSLGNLLLTALDMVASDELAAIQLAATLLGVDDVVLPSTTQRIHLVAELVDGSWVRGESEIPRSGVAIARLRIDPPAALPAPGVLEDLRTADMIVLGPGSLYTSVLATLVVPGVAGAVAAARSARVFICNVMTEPGETDGYGLTAHLEALAAHGLPSDALDYVVVNTQPIAPTVQARYAAQGAEPVKPDFTPPRGVPLVIRADLLDPGPVARHAPSKLGPLLYELGTGHVERVYKSRRPDADEHRGRSDQEGEPLRGP